MSNLWYQNPRILLEDLDQFFPNKHLNREQKINAIARFAIYYTILLLVFQQDNKWLSISIALLIISIYLGQTEEMTSENPIIANKECQEPTKDNPFMNFTVGDQITKPNRGGACSWSSSKKKAREDFRSKLFSDPSDVWGQFISDRNYYTMPNTEIVNDQTGFAKWIFGDSGKCKTEGNQCLKVRDPTYHRGRLTNPDY